MPYIGIYDQNPQKKKSFYLLFLKIITYYGSENNGFGWIRKKTQVKTNTGSQILLNRLYDPYSAFERVMVV